MTDPTPRPTPSDQRWSITTRGDAYLEVVRRLDAARAMRGFPDVHAYQLAKAAQARRVFAAISATFIPGNFAIRARPAQ